MTMLFPELEPILLLSIKKEHIDRIFKGEKLYELRKILPKTKFSHVYFYQTEGGGIVGQCTVDEIIEGTPLYVWSRVGEMATTKDRFDSYFTNKRRAYAIRISNPVKFETPLITRALKEYIPSFTIPQSYLLITPNHPLFRILQFPQPLKSQDLIQLRQPSLAELEQFCNLVEVEIGPRYPDTGQEFSQFIQKIYLTGTDPNGFLTIGKEIISITNSDGILLGFSVLTFKRGRAIKTGPTMLFPCFRGQGLGPKVRSALEDRAISLGASKVYCTCPADDKPILFHLLKCGYKIEGHLEKQYSEDSNEIIFAKELVDSPRLDSLAVRKESTPGHIVEYIRNESSLARSFGELLLFAGLEIPFASSKRIISDFGSAPDEYKNKPRKSIWLMANDRPIGVSLIAYKRGGSARGVIGIKTTHTPSMDKLISACIDLVSDAGRRKLYFLHPILDSKLVNRFNHHGFSCEGILRGAYVAGVDIGVFSKMLR